MYKIIQATRDSYITNKIVGQIRVTDANVGQAGSIDIFKLYDENEITGETNPIELSRGLVYFDLSSIKALTASSLDITSDSFTSMVVKQHPQISRLQSFHYQNHLMKAEEKMLSNLKMLIHVIL